MLVVWCAQPGLFADAFASSLVKLRSDAEVVSCDPLDCCTADEGLAPTLVVLDVDVMPDAPGQLVERWCERFGACPVVALGTILRDEYIASILGAGAHAYLPKSYREDQALGVLKLTLSGSSFRPRMEAEASSQPPLDQAALAIARDPYGLTERELEVLELVCEGLPNAEVAKRLGIKVGTTKIHLNSCYRKLGVENRAQAIRIAERIDHIRHIREESSARPGAVRGWLLPYMSSQRCSKGSVLFRKGDPGRELYYLQEGRVRLVEIGKEMGPEDLFGEIGIFSPHHMRTCSAQCETDVRLLSLTADQAKRLYFENPEFAYHVTLLITQRLLADQQRSH